MRLGQQHPVITPGSGARSSDVRVRYFDPLTGEPREAPTRSAGERPREATDYEKIRRVPVLVDGVEFPSIRAAADNMGMYSSNLQRALRLGGGRAECRGHVVERMDR